MDDEKKSKRPTKIRKAPPPLAEAINRTPRLETIREAAVTLRLTEAALRSRCRRAFANPDANGNAVIAPGVHAIKMGKHWRIKYV
jgi:hypothetical protein